MPDFFPLAASTFVFERVSFDGGFTVGIVSLESGTRVLIVVEEGGFVVRIVVDEGDFDAPGSAAGGEPTNGISAELGVPVALIVLDEGGFLMPAFGEGGTGTLEELDGLVVLIVFDEGGFSKPAVEDSCDFCAGIIAEDGGFVALIWVEEDGLADPGDWAVGMIGSLFREVGLEVGSGVAKRNGASSEFDFRTTGGSDSATGSGNVVTAATAAGSVR